MPDQAKEFPTLKRFVVDAQSRTNMYLKKINKNLKVIYHLWNPECSLLSREESLHLILTQLPVNTGTLVHFLWGRIWWVLEYKYQITRYIHRTSKLLQVWQPRRPVVAGWDTGERFFSECGFATRLPKFSSVGTKNNPAIQFLDFSLWRQTNKRSCTKI